jgi:hypothetical protein
VGSNYSFCIRVGNYRIGYELPETECRRVLHHYRLQGELDDEGFVEGTTILAMTPSIKQKAAGSFPVVIKTLEYIDTYGPVKLKIYPPPWVS